MVNANDSFYISNDKIFLAFTNNFSPSLSTLVRSRVLMSVVDDLESEEFDQGSMLEALLATAPVTPAAALMPVDNGTRNIVAMESVAKEAEKTESQMVASPAWQSHLIY